MEIGDSGLYIIVDKEDKNTYKYTYKKGKEGTNQLIDLSEHKPKKIGIRTVIGQFIISKIKKLVDEDEYQDIGINVYYKQQMEKLEQELQIKLDNQYKKAKDSNEYNIDGYILDNGIYYKVDFRNGELVREYDVLNAEIVDFKRITDFSKDTTNHFEIKLSETPDANGHREKYFFKDTKSNIVRSLINNDLAWNEQYLKNFIYKFIMNNSAKYTEQGVIGGYSSFNDIKEPSEVNISELTDYFKNILTKKHLEVIKATILIPFHWILRDDDDYMSRGIVKFVVLHGAPSAFKNGIVNIVRNMFDFYNNIPIDDSGTPNTYASLRNAINDNLGFVLCDESNNVFLDDDRKFRAQADNSVENLLKGIFQKRMPAVSSKEIGDNIKQNFHGTPIFIWNDDFKRTEALKDRCFVLCFNHRFNDDYENLFSVKHFKKQLLFFGEAFAWCLASNWNEGKKLRNIRDYETLINNVFELMYQKFKIDTQFLIDTKIVESDDVINIKDIFFNRMHYKLYSIHNLNQYVNEAGINKNVFDLMHLDFLKAKDKKGIYVYFNKNKFINYIRDKVANDGGLRIDQIEEVFDFEVNNNVKGDEEEIKEKKHIFNISNVPCYKYKIKTFIEECTTDIDDDDNIIPKETTQSSIL